jgi:hypothetical protein
LNSTLKAIVIAIAIIALVVSGIYVYGEITNPATIPAEGNIETNGGVLLVTPNTLDFGTIYPGTPVTQQISFKNNSTDVNDIITDMHLSTAEWSNSTDIGLTIDWDYTGTNIYPTQTIDITFTLTPSTTPTEGPFNFVLVIDTET